MDLAAKNRSAKSVTSKQAGSSVVGSSNTGPLQSMRPSPEQCNEQWMRALVKNGLAFSGRRAMSNSGEDMMLRDRSRSTVSEPKLFFSGSMSWFLEIFQGTRNL